MNNTTKQIASIVTYQGEALVRYVGETWEQAAVRQARRVAPKGEKNWTAAEVRVWCRQGVASGVPEDVAAASACWEFEVGIDADKLGLDALEVEELAIDPVAFASFIEERYGIGQQVGLT